MPKIGEFSMINNPLANLFGKSPIKPLQEHMTAVVECAELLEKFFEAAMSNDWGTASATHDLISDAEHRADELKRYLRLHLPKSLFMPISRSDLLDLLSVQDHIANSTKDISGIMLGRQMCIPLVLQEQMQYFVVAAIAVATQALVAINELDELLETGFGGSEIDLIEKLIERLDQLEDETDRLERDIRHKLFAIESELPPINAMFLYQIIDGIGDLADRAERVGGRLQLLVAR
jgi:predicted phosphate transport protein (TIGR00153 family)